MRHVSGNVLQFKGSESECKSFVGIVQVFSDKIAVTLKDT